MILQISLFPTLGNNSPSNNGRKDKEMVGKARQGKEKKLKYIRKLLK